LTFAAGPGLTVPLGQLRGAWGGRKAHRNVVALINSRRTLNDAMASAGSPARSEIGAIHDSLSPSPFHFRIAHLMWLAAWASLMLSVIRFSGIASGLVLRVLLGWLAYQTLALWLGWRIVRHLVPWWTARRQTCST